MKDYTPADMLFEIFDRVRQSISTLGEERRAYERVCAVFKETHGDKTRRGAFDRIVELTAKDSDSEQA